MTQLTASELAAALHVSKGRVSQWVSEGKLEGCFSGAGRLRRFDVLKCRSALNRLDPGQMLGNGAATKRALFDIGEPEAGEPADLPQRPLRSGSELPAGDLDRYELARIQKAEEEARKLRRQNAEAEGQFVLAAEVERSVARTVAQEVAQFEAVLREGARKVADRLGVDFKTTRQILVECLREHRHTRAEVLDVEADRAEMTAAERGEDI